MPQHREDPTAEYVFDCNYRDTSMIHAKVERVTNLYIADLD